MQIPPEISFHNVNKEAWAEDAILSHVARLEDIYQRLITCRVRVDQRANNSRHTIPPVVRIEMSVPGAKDIVVAHEPDHLQRKFQTPDLHNAINDAFQIAERRLSEYKQQLTTRCRTSLHESENEFLGQVAELPVGEEFGFLLTKEGNLLYFHRNSILSGDFDKLKRGTALTYVEDVGDTGPIATKVRVKMKNGKE